MINFIQTFPLLMFLDVWTRQTSKNINKGSIKGFYYTKSVCHKISHAALPKSCLFFFASVSLRHIQNSDVHDFWKKFLQIISFFSSFNWWLLFEKKAFFCLLFWDHNDDGLSPVKQQWRSVILRFDVCFKTEVVSLFLSFLFSVFHPMITFFFYHSLISESYF